MNNNVTKNVIHIIEAVVLIGLFACRPVGAHHSALLPVFEAELARAGVKRWSPQLAAQIQVESAWKPDARSKYAAGLAQFTPATWQDIAPRADPSCAGKPETDPACSIRSQIVYMRRLLSRYRSSLTAGDRWAFAWAAYNGGPGWITREKSRCKRKPNCNPSRWWRNVERHCIRAGWACRENRAYPKKILGRIR